MVKPPCGPARPAQHAADLPTHGGGAEHPAARKHRALATVRALAARREIAGRGMETTDSQRLTVTPAAPETSDALPGTPLPHAEKRPRSALAGFLGPGAPRARGRRAPCRSPKPTNPAWARLPGRRSGRADGCAGRGSRYRPRSAMASASSNRIVKGMHKTGFRLGSQRHLVSSFHVFVVSRFPEICPRAGWRVAAAYRLMQMCMDAGPPAGRSGAPAADAGASGRAASIPLSADLPNRVRPFRRCTHPLYRYRGCTRARSPGPSRASTRCSPGTPSNRPGSGVPASKLFAGKPPSMGG